MNYGIAGKQVFIWAQCYIYIYVCVGEMERDRFSACCVAVEEVWFYCIYTHWMAVLQYAKALAESRAPGLNGNIGARVIKMTP